MISDYLSNVLHVPKKKYEGLFTRFRNNLNVFAVPGPNTE